RVEQFALYGRGVSGSGFEIEGHCDAPMKNGACTTPSGAMACPVVGRKSARGRRWLKMLA
ncbi:hypothetical protein, partial [Pseudomonas aeruginosa]|uniref:hypothetical protein n=1 Tax=Pseudomonas aeruginosa TaxID=287 RepID=UPI001ABC4F2D